MGKHHTCVHEFVRLAEFDIAINMFAILVMFVCSGEQSCHSFKFFGILNIFAAVGTHVAQ